MFFDGDDADVVECPDYIAKNLVKYQIKFDEWMGDENNDHGYWVYDEEEDDEPGLCYDSEAFVEWLNKEVLVKGEEKAALVKKYHKPREEEKKLPKLYF